MAILPKDLLGPEPRFRPFFYVYQPIGGSEGVSLGCGGLLLQRTNSGKLPDERPGCADFGEHRPALGPAGAAYNASLSRSPVRMRTAISTDDTKILPSPMRPARAELVMASTTRST